jgi:hypothetical protein
MSLPRPRALPDGAIPWRSSPPAKHAPAPAAPSCRSADLRTKLTWQGLRGEAAAGTVRLTNTGPAVCSLRAGPASFELLDEQGVRLPAGRPVGSGGPYRPRPSEVVLRPHGAATAPLRWFNWCGPPLGLAAVRVVLVDAPRPLASTSAPQAVTPPPCHSPGASSTLEGDTLSLATPTAGSLYGDAGTLEIRLAVPRLVTAGSPLRYRVTLANPRSWTVPMRPCPTYTDIANLLGPGTGWTVHLARSHTLNCGPLNGELRPGERATFEMVTPIPGTARPGPSLLTWMIGTGGTEAEFRVTAP